MHELENMDDSPAKRLKNIISAIDNTSAKNVYVTINRNGVEFSFRTQTDYLFNESCYSSWYMQPSDKLKFRELFGKNDNYKAEEITDILYRGKSIYSAEPYVGQKRIRE